MTVSVTMYVCVRMQVHIESEHHDGGGERAPEVDFFDEHSSAQFEQPAPPPPEPDNQYSEAAQLSAHEVGTHIHTAPPS